jgi:hypothetical protein
MIENWLNVSLSKVDALRECIDLCSNGYRVLFVSQTKDSWFVKLRHCTNGNMISVVSFDNRYVISKNGKPVKTKIYAFDSLRYSLLVNSDNEKFYSYQING